MRFPRRGAAEGERIVTLGLDPFLLRMLRSLRPQATLRAVDGEDQLLQEGTRNPRLVVQAVPGPHLVDQRSDLAARTITIVDPRAESVPEVGGPVLLRPVERRALRLAIAEATGERRSVRDRLARAVADRLGGWTPEVAFALLRLLATVVVVVDVVAVYPPVGQRAVVTTAVTSLALLVHAIWRLRRPWLDEVLLGFDVALALAAAFTLGIHPSPALLLVMVGIVALGSLGTLRGAIGLLLALGSVTWLIASGPLATALSISLVLLLLTAGLLGIAIGEVALSPRGRSLHDVHQALRDLHGVAHARPSQLHPGALRADVLDRALDELGADAVALACGDRRAWDRPLFRGDLDRPGRAVVRRAFAEAAALRRTTDVTEGQLGALMGGEQVLATPLTHDGIVLGLLVVGWSTGPSWLESRTRRLELTRLAEDAAIALDTAELFAAIDALSVTGERQRIARDLHDGIVQSFVHVGMELDRLADELTDRDLQAALRVLQLRSVVHGTVGDARSVISRLRGSHLEQGLRAALESHLAELRGADAVELRLEWTAPHEEVAEEVGPDLFRLVQEAVANARQHAEPSLVRVAVAQVGDAIRVEVADDGTGRGSLLGSVPDRGRGLLGMRERLRLLGGDLDLRANESGGTSVIAIVPDAWSVPSGVRPVSHVPEESLR